MRIKSTLGRNELILITLLCIRAALAYLEVTTHQLSLEQYANKYGSDELTFFNQSQTVINLIANKYILNSILIKVSSFSSRWLGTDLGVYVALKQLISGALIIMYYKVISLTRMGRNIALICAIALTIDPFLYSISKNMLRDDLISYSFCLFTVAIISAINYRRSTILLNYSIIISLITLITTRPQLPLLFTMAYIIGKVNYRSWKLNRKSVIFTTLIITTMILFFRYETWYFLSSINLSNYNVLNTMYRYFLSPAPWNISKVMNGSLNSDASYAPSWFFIRFFISLGLGLLITIRWNLISQIVLLKDMIKTIIICVIVMGLIGGGVKVHGPRLGYPLFLSLLPVYMSTIVLKKNGQQYQLQLKTKNGI